MGRRLKVGGTEVGGCFIFDFEQEVEYGKTRKKKKRKSGEGSVRYIYKGEKKRSIDAVWR